LAVNNKKALNKFKGFFFACIEKTSPITIRIEILKINYFE